jgi:hypothetical protein
VNYVQWKSCEALAALMQEQLRIAKSFAPVLYALRACIPAAR